MRGLDFIITKKLLVLACLLMSFSALEAMSKPKFFGFLKIPCRYRTSKSYSKDLYNLVLELVERDAKSELSREFELLADLLSKGADPAALFGSDSAGLQTTTALHLAAMSEKTQILQVILENAPEIEQSINILDINEMTPLHSALWINSSRRGVPQSREIHWRKENIDRLLAFGADPKTQEKYGHSPLMLAIRCNWPQETIKLLLDNGADPDAQTSKGIAPLHYLMRHTTEDYQTAKLLLEKNANPNIKTDEGYAPIHLAVRYKAYHTVKLLLHHNADPQQQDALGDTLLLQLGIEADSLGSPYISRTEQCRNQGFNENELNGLYQITRALLPNQVK